MPTLMEELEKLKRRRPELSMSRSGNLERTLLEQGQIMTEREKIRGLNEPNEGVTKTTFLDKIGKRRKMTWQEKTGIQIYDVDKQRRFMLRDYLSKMEDAPGPKSRMAYAKAADVLSRLISGTEKSEVDLASSLISGETTRERTGVLEAAGVATAEHRAATLGLRGEEVEISRLGLESLSESRRDTAAHQRGMLGVAKTTRPGSVESRVARLQLQQEKDISDVIQKTGPPEGELDPEKRSFWKTDAPNESMKAIQAIDARYAKVIAGLQGKSVDKSVKAPSFEDIQKVYVAKGKEITREQWEAFLKSPEGRKRYPGGK